MLKRILIHTRSVSLGILPLGHKDLAIHVKNGLVVLSLWTNVFRRGLRQHVAMTVFVTLRRNWNLGVYVVTINLHAVNIRIVFHYYQAKIFYHVAALIRFVVEIWRTQGLYKRYKRYRM
jgi:hypothetical protein